MKKKKLYFLELTDAVSLPKLIYWFSHLHAQNIKHKVLWVRPGSTPFILVIKSIARSFFSSLPKPGRSKKREEILKKGNLGSLWFYLTFIDLSYIFFIKVPLLNLFGYKVVFDRHIFDALIDYQIMLDRDLFDVFLIKLLLNSSKSTTKIYLEIPIEVSISRCNQKWEPFPDTEEEKVRRYNIYREHINNLNYIQLNGLQSPESIHKTIVEALRKA